MSPLGYAGRFCLTCIKILCNQGTNLLIFRLLDDSLVTARDLDPIKRYLPLVERHRVSMRYSTFDGIINDTVIQVSYVVNKHKVQLRFYCSRFWCY